MARLALGQMILGCMLLAACQYDASSTDTSNVEKKSAYERVMRTGTLRCGYVVYPPETIKDPNTAELSGTIVETVNEIGRQLGWQIEWSAEVGTGDMFEGLKSGKYDALCAGAYETPDRSKLGLFSTPFNYGATYTFVRSDDTRFDSNLEAIDDPDVRIATIDGEISQAIAKERFPKAKTLSLPTLSDMSQVMESVATGKADVAFSQMAPAKPYMQNSPGKLRPLTHIPARTYPAGLLVVPHGEHDLKYIVDSVLRTLHENGFVEKILRKYDPDLKSYLLVAKPYVAAKQ